MTSPNSFHIEALRRVLQTVDFPNLRIHAVGEEVRRGFVANEPHLYVNVTITDNARKRRLFSGRLYHTLEPVRLQIAGLEDAEVLGREVARMMTTTARDMVQVPEGGAVWFTEGMGLLRTANRGQRAAAERHWQRLLSHTKSGEANVESFANLIRVRRDESDKFLHFGKTSWWAFLAYHRALFSGDAGWAYDDLDESLESGYAHIGLTGGSLENLWM